MWCAMVGWWDVLGDGGAPVALAEVREPGCEDVGSQSPEKNRGAPSNDPGARLFYLSISPTKSNPDMRNSKLAHIQAGF